MNGLAHRHSGHAPNDLSHLHQLYQLHYQHHQQQQQQQPELDPVLANGGSGFNYPFISSLFTHLESKRWDQKRLAAGESSARLPPLLAEHGEFFQDSGPCGVDVRRTRTRVLGVAVEFFEERGETSGVSLEVRESKESSMTDSILEPIY